MPEPIATCPVEEAIRIIGGKLLVLRSLLLNGSQRYNELLRTVTAISQKELTRNLKQLSNAGLVTSSANRYDLTKLGKGRRIHSPGTTRSIRSTGKSCAANASPCIQKSILAERFP